MGDGFVSDTSSEIEVRMIEGYRRMNAAQKLACVRALTRSVQELALADIRRRHPQAGERELTLRLHSRWLEPELMARVFSWDPRREGY